MDNEGTWPSVLDQLGAADSSRHNGPIASSSSDFGALDKLLAYAALPDIVEFIFKRCISIGNLI